MLSIMDICVFCKEELEKTFNEQFDIIEDCILDKVLYMIFDAYEIDYQISNKYLGKVLQNIKSMNLGKFKKDEAGNIIDILDEDTIIRIKQLCSLYCIISYNAIKNIINEATLYNDFKKIDEEFNEKNKNKLY